MNNTGPARTPMAAHQPTLITYDEAAALARHLNADAEDGWTYRVLPLGDDRCAVYVRDADGTPLGPL